MKELGAYITIGPRMCPGKVLRFEQVPERTIKQCNPMSEYETITEEVTTVFLTLEAWVDDKLEVIQVSFETPPVVVDKKKWGE